MPLSYQNYTGDNVTTTFNIPFTYTATSEISVTVDGVAQTGLTFPSASQVQLTSAPASSTVVQVRRTTDLTSRAVDFASGSVLTEEDLDNANIQIFHSSQEAVDLTDDTIQEDIDSKWDAESKVIKNVANPTNAQDAATKDYLENTWLTTADKAQLNSLNTTNLNTVATNIANVNAVAADATDIGTVSTNIASVNTVATNIADVITVANDLNEAISEIETAADDLNEAVSDIDTVSTNIANVNTVGGAITNVNTVATNIGNVNTVGGNITNVNTVGGISGNVTTVAGISANVGTVAGISGNVTTVAGISGDVSTVSGNNSNVTIVANDISNVNSVAGNATNINSVAGNSTNINTVATNNTNINTVATNIANVNSVVANSANINSVAGNETNINSAVANATNINTVATNISNVNSVGGSIANVNTVATNLASVNNFGEVYRISASAPTTSLDVGDLYFDTTSDTLKVYGASGWQNAGSSVNGTSQRYHYDISGTPTSVTGVDANGNTLAYDAGYVDVYVNGVRMSQADVTVTSGDTVTFASALANGDEVDIVGYGTFNVASLNADNLDSGTVPSARVSGAYTGITGTGALNAGTITSGFGNIDTGSSTITTTGAVTTGALSAKGGAVFNEDSADVDFRVESNDDANMFRIEAATNNVKIGSNAGNYGQLSIKNEKAGSQERGLYVEVTPASGTSPNNVAVFAATNSNMTQPLVRIHHESPTADQLLLQATTTGSNTVKFSVDEDGDIYTAGGVYLGGTGSANYLDDYEEGTWTPSVGGNATYNSQIAQYIKIGNIVHVTCNMHINTIGTGSGNTLSGLPFTSFNNNAPQGGVNVMYYTGISTSMIWVSGYVNNNSTTVYFSGNTVSSTSIQHNSQNMFQNNTRIDFSATYRVS